MSSEKAGTQQRQSTQTVPEESKGSSRVDTFADQSRPESFFDSMLQRQNQMRHMTNNMMSGMLMANPLMNMSLLNRPLIEQDPFFSTPFGQID